MGDWKIALQDAERWLDTVGYAIDNGYWKVAVAQCAHSLIRANDSLTIKFLGRKALRHDDTFPLFKELITGNHINPEYSRYQDVLKKWIKGEKPKAEYREKEYFKRDATTAFRDAEKFLKMCKTQLGI